MVVSFCDAFSGNFAVASALSVPDRSGAAYYFSRPAGGGFSPYIGSIYKIVPLGALLRKVREALLRFSLYAIQVPRQ